MMLIKNDKFSKAYSEAIPTVFLKAGFPELTWDEVFEFINNRPDKRVNRKLIPSENAFFYNDAQIIPKVNSVVQQFHTRFSLGNEDPVVLVSQLFATIIPGEGTMIPRHQDPENNLFWQGKGRTRWTLYTDYNTTQPYMDIILEEGDAIYVPKNTIHHVEPLGARFSIAILFDNML